jgi:hypothetical protein
MMKHNNTIIAVILFMVVGAFARLIPHMPNFTPVESLTIFGAAYLSKKHWALILSVFLIYVSDFIINNTIARSFFPDVEGIVWFSSYMIYNFVAMALIVLVSSKIITKVNIKNVGVSVLLASIIFFIITNFGSWAGDKSVYSNDMSGLMASFTAGLPFFRNSLLSNVVFTTVIFGSFEMYTSIAARQKTTAEI